MFDIGWSELLVIGVVALIAIGPKELPGVLRACGQWMGKIRRMASDFQDQFREAMREAEVDDLKKTVDDMAATASSYTNFDPIADVKKDFENLSGEQTAPPPAATAEAAAPSTVATEPATLATTDPGAVEPPSVASPAEAGAAPVADSNVATVTPEPPRKAGEGA